MMKKITVLGSGSFGTALGVVLAKNNHNVMILSRSPEVAESINSNHINPKYFSNYTLPSNLVCTTDRKLAFEGTSYILHAIPIQSTTEYLENLKDYINPNIPFISTSKGIHATTLKYMNEIVPEALGFTPPMAFFSGPTFARELIEEIPSATVVASESEELAIDVSRLFRSASLRVYVTTDVIGVEVGGALKNIFAIAAGIADGLGLGLNTMATLVTIGCGEMRKLALKLGARPETFQGLSGIGDLMLTCYGSLSRNRQVGQRLGKGEKLTDILASMSEVAEGVHTTAAAVKLMKNLNLELPIITAVGMILEDKISPREAINNLMTRPQVNFYEVS